MISMLTFAFVFYEITYTNILVHEKTISGKIPKKLGYWLPLVKRKKFGSPQAQKS